MKPIVPLAADDADALAPPSALVAGWMMESSTPNLFTLFPNVLVTDNGRPVELPMTMHMRLWAWPREVGPINVAGDHPRTTTTPRELGGDSGLFLPSIPSWPRGDDPMATTPTYGLVDSEKIPSPEQDAMGIRNVWTRQPTLPMYAPSPIGGLTIGSNVRFVISGVTRDGTGAALGSCTVSAFRVDELVYPNDPDVFSDPMVSQTVSDASTGSYSIQVGFNTAHQLTGYKTGSPDLAGITVNTVTPVAV